MRNKIYARTYLLSKLKKYKKEDLIQGLKNVIEYQDDNLGLYDDVCEFTFKNLIDESVESLNDYEDIILNNRYNENNIIYESKEYVILEFRPEESSIVARYRYDVDTESISMDEDIFKDILISWAKDSLDGIFGIKI